jgi:putative iron-regulated protein
MAISAINTTLAADKANQTQQNTATQRPVDHPLSYRLTGSDRHAYAYDGKTEIGGYAQLVADSYASALADGQALKAAIDAFLAAPGDETLVRARDAWVLARRSWEQTETFRFYDGPIDVTDNEAGPIGRLDGWPVEPSAIDYVENNPTAGIVNDMKLALTRATLLGRENATGPDHAVTTGWHAIEFLLWGQEPNGLGEPGDRPVTDYLPGQPNNDRRRTYLKLVTDMLVEDLTYLVESWDVKSRNSYAGAFKLLNQREALGRMMNGMARLTGEELASGRLAAALDSKDRLLLTSRFSGASYQDFVFALRGVRNVWTGDQGGETRPGLALLVARVDPVLAQRIGHALNQAEESVSLLHTPLERETLPAPAGSPARQMAERAIADLKRIASLLRDAGVKLGVNVILPN